MRHYLQSELWALNKRTTKLDNYIRLSTDFTELSARTQRLMEQQRDTMIAYARILEMRIYDPRYSI